MISANSRYSNSVIVPANDLDGNDILAIAWTEPVNRPITFQIHMVRGSDTIDGIAYKIFGDATLWWVIANLNPEIVDFSALPLQYPLRVPQTTASL